MPSSSAPLVSSSQIGLGCVTFGREIDESAAFALMDHAVANGVRFFDTAQSYASGESEKIVGHWLAAQGRAADSIRVATKFRPPFTGAGLSDGIRQSSARLQRETI